MYCTYMHVEGLAGKVLIWMNSAKKEVHLDGRNTFSCIEKHYCCWRRLNFAWPSPSMKEQGGRVNGALNGTRWDVWYHVPILRGPSPPYCPHHSYLKCLGAYFIIETSVTTLDLPSPSHQSPLRSNILTGVQWCEDLGTKHEAGLRFMGPHLLCTVFFL